MMNSIENDFLFLKQVYALLEGEKIKTIVFGGWAEELQEIIPHGLHKDIDLLYVSEDFEILDRFIEKLNLKIVKCFPHKRAFLYKGIMIELFLVKEDGQGYHTNFFNSYMHLWPLSTFGNKINGMNVASIETLISYQLKHDFIEKASVGHIQTA